MRLPPEPSAESIDDALVKALVAEGLYEKEARAMVKTWETSWFGTEGTGTRLLYTVPRRVTDKLLPLRISPTPDETVRVLVGRIDILTPEQEAKLAAMLPRAGTADAISREEAMEMRALGRFLSPAVDRACGVAGSEAAPGTVLGRRRQCERRMMPSGARRRRRRTRGDGVSSLRRAS